MRKPVLIVIAGPNGSGKTSTTRLVVKHEWAEKCVYINPDEIAQSKFGDWNSCNSQTGCIFTITRLTTRMPNCYSVQRMVSSQNNMLIHFLNGRKL